jgi:SAM-dependent methyltransferase
VRRFVPQFAGKRVGDFGCGYEATFMRTVLAEVQEAVLVDVALAPDLKEHPHTLAIEAGLPDALAKLDDESLDVVLLLSVLEHLTEPDATLAECRRLLAAGGVLLVNVPTWLGKRALEFSAFRLGLSPVEEMDDHKTYYDPRDLWPLIVRAGFTPHNILCRRHKCGLNTLAVCRIDLGSAS